MKSVIPLFAIFLLPPGNALAVNRVYHYEPETVELNGVIEQQTFPGPPNYENIARGDKRETGWYLRLDEPIDVEESERDTDQNSALERNIKVLQLATDFKPSVKPMLTVGTKRFVKGHLFHSLTGHHHSRVLLWVDAIKATAK